MDIKATLWHRAKAYFTCNSPFARRFGGVLGHVSMGLKCTISGPRLSQLWRPGRRPALGTGRRPALRTGLTALLTVAVVTVAAAEVFMQAEAVLLPGLALGSGLGSVRWHDLCNTGGSFII